MNRLEELIRDAFTAHEREAPDPANLLADLHSRDDRSRGKDRIMARIAPAVYVALIIGIALYGAVYLAGRSQRAAEPPPAGPAVPEGMKPVSFHGVQVFVPASWPISPERSECDRPTSDFVELPFGAVTSIGCFPKPSLAAVTAVRFDTADSPRGQQRATVATEAVIVDGHTGRRGAGVAKGETTEMAVLVLPDPGVVISVASPDEATAQRILDSTRVVPVDSYGCVDHVEPLTPAGASERSGAGSQLVPGEPISGAVCLYGGSWLAHSVRLSNEQMGNLRSILNALPPGVSQPGEGFSATEEACREEQANGYIVTFGYASGPRLDVYVHIGGCADLSASNGSRTTKINAPLVTFLADVAHYVGGFPDPHELR